MPDDRTPASVIEERLSIISDLASLYASSSSIAPDGSLAIEWMTGALTKITGYTPEDINEQGWQSIVHPEDLPIITQSLGQLLAGHNATSEYRIITKDGATRWLRSYTRPVWNDEQGRVGRIYSAVQDITEQKLTEETLLARERDLTDFIENAALGLHWVGPDGTILWTNQAELDLLGYTREEYVGRNIAEFHADRDVIKDILLRLSNKEMLHSYEARLRCKDGSIKYVLISSNVRWENDQFIHTRCFTRDITDRKLAEKERETILAREKAAREKAEKADRAKDIFLATVSHELRTPLNAITGWVGMLRKGNLDKESLARAIEVIERNTRSQTQLIEDLLDISRIVSGKMRLDVEMVELPPVIQGAVEAVRPGADAKEIRLQAVLDPKASPVSGDASRIQQIVWNLLSNAVKFTPKGGRVQVRLQRINSHVEIVVSDTGQGFSQEFSPYLFERFYQGDGSKTRAHSGLGLGLAIVRHLVELHGGTVSAFSSGEGQGATFTVKLPLRIIHDTSHLQSGTFEQEPPMSSDGLESECPSSLKGLRLLIVEDEPDSRELLIHLLKECEAEVKAVASVREALALIEQWQPDLLVSDIEMPEEDGYSLIRKVRLMDGQRGGRLPAVALTAHARGQDRMRALKAGFDAHVAKPFEVDELITVLGSLAKRSGRI